MLDRSPERRQDAAERLAYSTDEAAALLGVSHTTVRNLIHAGDLATVTIGKRRLVRRETIIAFLDAREGGAS